MADCHKFIQTQLAAAACLPDRVQKWTEQWVLVLSWWTNLVFFIIVRIKHEHHGPVSTILFQVVKECSDTRDTGGQLLHCSPFSSLFPTLLHTGMTTFIFLLLIRVWRKCHLTRVTKWTERVADTTRKRQDTGQFESIVGIEWRNRLTERQLIFYKNV